MPTRNIVLTDPQTRLVEQLVASGRYQNASEVLRDGLRLVEEREQARAARLASLRDAVAVGVADIDAGRYQSFDDPSALNAHVASLAKPSR